VAASSSRDAPAGAIATFIIPAEDYLPVKTGLLLGRFQPFHKGHLFALRLILKENDRAAVIIGSAQASHDAENPFSAGERMEMIRASLTADELTRTAIVPVEDINRYPLWVAHVESRCPKFECVYSRNSLTAALFRQAGYEVVEHDYHKRGTCSGTEIRLMMRTGKGWRAHVPEGAAAYIDRIGGVERVKSIG
jgi:nicotinamide-nucleotide adenylyltransferase